MGHNSPRTMQTGTPAHLNSKLDLLAKLNVGPYLSFSGGAVSDASYVITFGAFGRTATNDFSKNNLLLLAVGLYQSHAYPPYVAFNRPSKSISSSQKQRLSPSPQHKRWFHPPTVPSILWRVRYPTTEGRRASPHKQDKEQGNVFFSPPSSSLTPSSHQATNQFRPLSRCRGVRSCHPGSCMCPHGNRP